MKRRLIFILFSLVLLTSCQNSKSKIPFEKEKWEQADLRIRGRMVDDLFKQNLLVGKTKREVKNLLGEPDYEEDFYLSYKVDLGKMYVYDLIVKLDSTSRKTAEVLLDD